MAEQVSSISRAVSDVLTGAYARKRLTQEELSRRTEMPLVTLQKKLRGRSPISATDLVIIANAIGVSPARVLDEALEDLGEEERRPLSVPVVSIADHQKKKTPATMTEEEMEGERSAANNDPEIGHDEQYDS